MRSVQLTLIGILTTFSMSSHAIIIDAHGTACRQNPPDSLGCTITITTALPWLLVDGTNYDLNAAETQVQLVNEASGAAEMRLLPSLAEKLGASTESLKKAIVKAASQGKSLSEVTIKEALQE